jgi:hypothetical protein
VGFGVLVLAAVAAFPTIHGAMRTDARSISEAQ